MISNATSIICLSKINKLYLLKKLYNTIIVPFSVKKEILIEGKPGYFTILNAIKKGWIKVIEPKNKIDLGLGVGEQDAINLARERKNSIILDDAFAIKAAKTFDISIARTTTIIFMAANKKLITKDEAIKLLNQLIEDGYYISPKEYSILLTKLKK